MFISNIWLCLLTNKTVQARVHVSKCLAEIDTPRSDDCLDNLELLHAMDSDLMDWALSLPSGCCFRTLMEWELDNGTLTIAMQRTLLHLIHHAVMFILHRKQCMYSPEILQIDVSRQVHHMSRLRMREAVMHITRIVGDLRYLNLEHLLPLTDTIIAS